MELIKLAIAFLVVFSSPALFTQLGLRTAAIDSIQAESASRVGYQHIFYVQQSGLWSAATYPGSYSYFNAKDNSHLTSMMSSARVANLPVKIHVDETYVKINGFCQNVTISM